MFDKNFIFLDKEFNSSEEILEYLSNKLLEKDIVKESFCNAIKLREKEFPTGLQTNYLNFAIPHTDVEHVNEAKIVFLSLKNTVNFKFMADKNIDVNCKFVFLLAVKEAKEQVPTLMKLMESLSNEEFLKSIENDREIDSVYKKLSGILN